MKQRRLGTQALIGLALVAGVIPAQAAPAALSPAVLASLRRREPVRAGQVAAAVEQEKFSLGLGLNDGFKAGGSYTDAAGTIHVRFRQTYRGHDVVNGSLVGHLDANGGFQPSHATLQTGVDLGPAPALDLPRVEGSVKGLLGGELLVPLSVDLVVFPTRSRDGVPLDARSVAPSRTFAGFHPTRLPEDGVPFVWAYSVGALVQGEKGLVAREFILDAATGEVLKQWDGSQHDAPAKGIGHSHYNGTVTLDTTQLSDGSFVLRDTTRPIQPWPGPSGMWPEYGTPGNAAWFVADANHPTTNRSFSILYQNPANEWGDGEAFAYHVTDPSSSTGQASAVDAQFATQVTWDYLAQVLGWAGGIDGKGSTVMNILHADPGYRTRSASWIQRFFLVDIPDGCETGSAASLDELAHELNHGVMAAGANLATTQQQESGGLNEANSDVQATMIKFWQWGAGGTGATVPDTAPQAPHPEVADYPWMQGAQLSVDGLTAKRCLFKPSLGGGGHDAWFDGIGPDDPHFSAGPAERMFFFLSCGASPDASQPSHSDYLPGGMAGIGNQKAIQIWFHAMTTLVTDPATNYSQFRAAMVQSAFDLYGPAEVDAVKNAFAAVNVGPTAQGSNPVRVVFPVDPISVFDVRKTFPVPSSIPVKLPLPQVTNAYDPSVTWSLGGLLGRYEGGELTPDGTFIAPQVSFGCSWPVKATSVADPNQFAVLMVWSANLDCDGDTEVDACDAAAMALEYGGAGVYPNSNLYGSIDGCDKDCVTLFLECFGNAFNR